MDNSEKVINSNKEYYHLVNNYATKLEKKRKIQKKLETTMAELLELNEKFRNINKEISIAKKSINQYVDENKKILDINEEILDRVESCFDSSYEKVK